MPTTASLHRLWLLLLFGLGTLQQSHQLLAQHNLGKGLMPIGAYYYPEHWSEDQWARDLEKMAALGFAFTHYAEFAWSRLEPQEGQYEFAWLDRCLDLAEQNGLKVILCTPSPTPPAWLTEKHPEILVVDEQGLRRQHGGRLHAAYNHPTYRHYVEKIITQMARRYGQDPRVAGWQLDNEPHYASLYDYSAWQETQFRHWLRQKYGTIDSLNHAWGNAFWSQTYNHFDQIHLPNPKRGSNPHALVDFKLFSASEVAAGLRFQAQLLRETVAPSQWITTNYAYFKFLPSVDPFLNRPDLDFASHTMYLTSQILDDAGDALAHRLGSGLELSFSQELAQSVSGKTGIMELQPGQINWGSFNPQPLPGAVRMWVWHTFGLGDEFVCTYRFRQPLFGGEQTHHGILMADGVTVQRGGQEYVQAIAEIGKLRSPQSSAPPASWQSRRTALVWDPASFYDLEGHPHHQDWNNWRFIYTYYQALKRLGAAVDFVLPGDTLDPKIHPFLVVPAQIRIDSAQITHWQQYVEAGGHLILTCRTGTKDRNGHLWEAPLQAPIYSLVGAEVPYYDHLPAAHPGQIEFQDRNFNWHVWGDVLEPQAGTEILAAYADQFYQGKAAAIRKSHQEGTVTYLGAWSQEGEWEYQLLRSHYQQQGAEVLDLPPYVFVEWRDGYWVAVNYTAQEVSLPADTRVKWLHGSQSLPPAGVSVWQER